LKHSKLFNEIIGCDNSDAVFRYLISTLKDTITKWDYFINWGKVFENIRDIEIDLNLLNYLIGKDNIEQEFLYLLKKQPSIVKLIPILIACRQDEFKILIQYDRNNFTYHNFTFKPKSSLTDAEASEIVLFAKETGFLDLLKNKKIKNIVDYVIGVEAGLDSNGRKNRGGTMMEDIVEFFVKDICQRNGFEYISQATSVKIKQNFGLHLTVDKSSRMLDFAIYNKKNLYLIETNFYSGGGSKLKSTAGEYKDMFDYWKKDGHKFIWITDGIGWETTKRPLEETFNRIDYILNLDMISKNILEKIIVGNL